MSLPKATYTPPSLRNVQQKSEIIDRDGLGDVQCDLDYAPMRELPAKSGRIVLIALLQATIVGTIGAWLLGDFVVAYIWRHIPLAFIGVIALLTAVVLAVKASQSLEENAIRLLKTAWITAWSIGAILSTPFLMRPFIAALWLLIVALPPAIYFAYRFTTFGVYWITGHPLGDGDVMLRCRDLWQRRHDGVADSIPDTLSESSRDRERWQDTLRAIKSHDHGFLWCCVAVATALSVTWCSRESFPASVIGLHAVVSILFGLFVAAIVRCGGRLPFRLVKQMLFRWFMYDWDAQATPWMFQSPCGGMLFRRRWFWAVLAMVAIAVNHLAGAYVSVSVPVSQLLAIFWAEWTQPVLMTLITAVCCLAVPVTVLALIVCIIAGPALSAFDELYSE